MALRSARPPACLEHGERLVYPESEDILVVDPNRARREAIAALLRDEGFPVTTVAEGLAALRVIGTRRVALVVAAVRLPGTLDGLETRRQAWLRRPELRFLLVADYASSPRRGAPGSDDVIAAPFDRWELLGCVFELLHRKQDIEATDLARRCRGELLAS